MIPKRALWILRFVRLFRRRPKPHRVWKVEREENLGSYLHYGNHTTDITTMYRIAVYERCLVTGATRIRERHALHPV